MTSEAKHILKMSLFFLLFFIPFAWCAVRLLSGVFSTQLIDDPLRGGRMEPYGFILFFSGLGTALFGKELFDGIGEWRSMRRRRRPRKQKLS